MATNVKPEELNYDNYETAQYDEDIINSIPGHHEMHEEIIKVVKTLKPNPKILELGVGTGITTKIVAENTNSPHFILIDFSEQMLSGAKAKTHKYHCDYIFGDYSKIELPSDCDAVVTVIGFHHQGKDDDKKQMLKKVFNSLKDDGVFILGDLMTYDDIEESALNDAYHFHHLVEKAKDEKTLREWAHHHRDLNWLASWQKHAKWMKEIGFKDIEVRFKKYNTFLITAKR